MKCWIVKSWICYVETEEIPLEVCRLCTKTRLKHTIIKREVKADE
jgi:hypothetical protein